MSWGTEEHSDTDIYIHKHRHKHTLNLRTYSLLALLQAASGMEVELSKADCIIL